MKRPTLTTAFRLHVIAMSPGATLTTTDAKAWVASNLAKLGAPDQTQFTAEASCRCASQRLILDGWLVRLGKRNLYERTAQQPPEPWE